MYGLMTQREAAERLQVSVRTIQRWAQHGELPAPVKIGRSAYYTPDTVRNFVDKKTNVDKRDNEQQRRPSSIRPGISREVD